MARISYKGHRFPPSIIRHAVFLYFRFTPSLHDVEGMLAWRGIDVTYETIRVWLNKFGPLIAINLKRPRQNSSPRWTLDEMVCTIKGEHWYLWRAIDDEGVVLDLVMQRRRDKAAALKLFRKLLRNQPVVPEAIITDGLASYGAAHPPRGFSPRTPPSTAISTSNGISTSGATCTLRADAARAWKIAAA